MVDDMEFPDILLVTGANPFYNPHRATGSVLRKYRRSTVQEVSAFDPFSVRGYPLRASDLSARRPRALRRQDPGAPTVSTPEATWGAPRARTARRGQAARAEWGAEGRSRSQPDCQPGSTCVKWIPPFLGFPHRLSPENRMKIIHQGHDGFHCLFRGGKGSTRPLFRPGFPVPVALVSISWNSRSRSSMERIMKSSSTRLHGPAAEYIVDRLVRAALELEVSAPEYSEEEGGLVPNPGPVPSPGAPPRLRRGGRGAVSSGPSPSGRGVPRRRGRGRRGPGRRVRISSKYLPFVGILLLHPISWPGPLSPGRRRETGPLGRWRRLTFTYDYVSIR